MGSLLCRIWQWIWTAFGVTPPARELPADHPYRLDPDVKVGQDGIYVVDGFGPPTRVKAFDHPVTQADIDEGRAYFKAHEDLDAATDRFIAFNGGRATLGADIVQSRFIRDYYIWRYTATTRTPVIDKTAEPARIVAGGAMTLTVGGGINDMGQILAGGDLSVLGGAIKDTSLEVQATGEGHGTVQYSHVAKKGGVFGSKKRVYDDPSAYDEVIPPKTVLLGVARQEGHTAATSGKAPGLTAIASVDPAIGSVGGVSPGGRTAAIIEVPVSVQAPSGATGVGVDASGAAAVQANAAGATPTSTSSGTSAQLPLVVRTATPEAPIPTASLFKTAPGPSTHYLIETDPAFADYRTWLSSDYLLQALSHDPNTVQKRLGDGFYEQRLIREQVARLTGYRYTEGIHNDLDQYTALMDAGATFAQRFQLTPGIALTAAQMAQLTSDIVWLVEQTVTLADGSTERVLVPQVYVRVKPGDIDGSGALLSGERLVMKADPGRGDVVNTGTLAGRTLVSITADNIQNLGGRISSNGSIQASARTDLENLGGTIDAANAVVLKAGRDIRIASTSQAAVGTQSASTQLDRVAGVYVTNPGGTLVAQAGRDVALVGAILSNTGAGSQTLVKAGRDIALDTVKTSRSLDIVRDENNRFHTAESAEIGTRIIGGSGKTSSVTVLAGGDIVGRQVTVQTGGLVAMHADGDIELQAGRTTAETDSVTRSTKRKLLGGKTTTTTAETRYESLSQGSRIEGGMVSITANGAITGEGVKLKGDDGVLVQAGGVLDLHEARDIRSQSSEIVVKKGSPIPGTGLSVSGGSTRDMQSTFSDTANATTVESGHGGVLLKGGALAALQGVQVAAAGDVSVRADALSITGVLDQRTTRSEHEQRKSDFGRDITRFGNGVGAKGAEQALMDAGRTFVQRSQLTAGMALGAAQMAQLTSDIVWLVEQTSNATASRN